MLGALANNGGPTKTHALLPGSPAIDAGNPSASAGVGDVTLFDQRGAPFTRVHGSQIDIGAFELQPMPPAFFGDYNGDGEVETADYVMWRHTMGNSVTPYNGADGSGNGIIDEADRLVWRAHFGETIGAGSGATQELRVERQESRAGVILEMASQSPAEPLRQENETLALAEPVAYAGFGRSVALAHLCGSPGSARQNAASILWRDDALLAWMAQRVADDEVSKTVDFERCANYRPDDYSEISFLDATDAAFALGLEAF
jgi:hypothetical protein